MKIKHLLFVAFGIALHLACGHHHPAGHRVTLSWQPAQSATRIAAASYNVYRRTEPSKEFVRIASHVQFPWYEDRDVASGRTFFYVVTSLDEAGYESKFSGEVKATIP